VLKAWRTPFARFLFPQVTAILDGEPSTIRIHVVADETFEITFESVLALKLTDEGWDINGRFRVERDEDRMSSYTWLQSSWLREVDAARWADTFGTTINHYVILGGDCNVEILASGPRIIPAAA
jgi:hypothetical protein